MVKSKVFMIFIAISIALSGCASDDQFSGALGGSSTKTAAEKKLEADARTLSQRAQNIKVKNTVQAAVWGAALGCLFAELSDSDCGDGAAAGAVAGGFAGAAIGDQAAKADAAKQERIRVAQQLRDNGKKLDSFEVSLRKVVAAQDEEIIQLRKQVAESQITLKQADLRIKAINSNRSKIKSSLERSVSNINATDKKLVKFQTSENINMDEARGENASQKNRIEALRKTLLPHKL